MFAINHADPCICLADLAVISTTQYARGSKCTFQRREQFIRLTHVLNSIHAQTMQSQLNFQCNRYTRYIDVCVYICHRCEKHLKISKLLRACKSNLSQTLSKRWVPPERQGWRDFWKQSARILEITVSTLEHIKWITVVTRTIFVQQEQQ